MAGGHGENISIMPPKTKIFVGKLPPTCKDFELRKLFERYGEVTECSILGNYAFVHMKTEEQAATAIRNLNNWDMNGFKISVEQSTGEKRAGGMGGMRGGMGGGFRGRGGPMRGRGMGRPGPYDRRPPMGDRYGPPPPGPPPAPPMRNGYYEDYERRDRRPLPPAGALDRRPPPPMPREPAYRDPYDRYDSYDRMPPPPMGRRTPPPMDRRPPPMGYDRRDDPYGDMYGPRPEYVSSLPFCRPVFDAQNDIGETCMEVGGICSLHVADLPLAAALRAGKY
ncbi:RNA-binding protein 4 [Portunus trituberculatus]|uniref:RNA-binding protein 4 n=1 Tax=Portunus trituberculatus TaxID=210409 RepID=A0A5B7DKG5_PORTR|nr:RNA-binding protein 4 [Portunus trituberculatus]